MSIKTKTEDLFGYCWSKYHQMALSSNPYNNIDLRSPFGKFIELMYGVQYGIEVCERAIPEKN